MDQEQVFIRVGSLTHLSRHCFPHLPLMSLEHSVHLFGPCTLIQFNNTSSSLSVQLPFFADLAEFLNFCMHCLAFLFPKCVAIFSQFSPCSLTSATSWMYSSCFHRLMVFFCETLSSSSCLRIADLLVLLRFGFVSRGLLNLDFVIYKNKPHVLKRKEVAAFLVPFFFLKWRKEGRIGRRKGRRDLTPIPPSWAS